MWSGSIRVTGLELESAQVDMTLDFPNINVIVYIYVRYFFKLADLRGKHFYSEQLGK